MLSKLQRASNVKEVLIDSVQSLKSIMDLTSLPVESDYIDYSYIDWNHLAKYDRNINKKRDKEWLDSSHLDEIKSLEEELFFDTKLTVVPFTKS